MTVGVAKLDHIVINTLYGMEAAARCFAALGFTLTPLGRHSLGSINHLMMTPGPYLELVGVPDTGLQRQDVLDSPFGLNGLVLKSENADSTYARLQSAGFPVSAPTAFSRPVSIDGALVEARFRTVRIAAQRFPAGRVYFCQHLTPEYVWRPEWLRHPNGFRTIDRLVVASPNPADDALLYARACGASAVQADGHWRVALGGFSIDVIEGEKPCFLSLGLQFDHLDGIKTRAAAVPDAHWVAFDDKQATLTLASLGLRLDCRSMG